MKIKITKIKKFFSLFLMLSIFSSFIFTNVVLAKNSADMISFNGKDINILSLGDSIARGSGVGKSNSYGALIANSLTTEMNDLKNPVSVNYDNYGINGYTAGDFDIYINSGDDDVTEKIKSADIILLSVGGNEFMRFIGTEGTGFLEIKDTKEALKDTIIGLYSEKGERLKNYLKSNEFKSLLRENIKQFQESANFLIDDIFKLNSDVKILFTTIIEPIRNEYVSEVIRPIIAEYNKAILNKFNDFKTNENFKTIDCFKAFEEIKNSENPLTFTKIYENDIEKSIINIHPTKYGHNVMAQTHKSVIDEIVKNLNFVSGDVDGNGEMSTLDVLYVLKHIAKIEILSGEKLISANYDGNDSVNTFDALGMLKEIAGIK